MRLWTIQPEKVFQEIQDTGVYRCDIEQSSKNWMMQYDWLVSEMKKRIGLPPSGVEYPVWAWKSWQKGRIMPDLRAERWYYGRKNHVFFRLEIEIPDEKVLLSDFDAWGIILNEDWLSDTEEEDRGIEKIYKSLSPAKQKEMLNENWQRVFDITPFENGWIERGYSVQATFWELKKEQIRKVKKFISISKYS